MKDSLHDCRRALVFLAFCLSYPDAAWRARLGEIEEANDARRGALGFSALRDFLKAAAQAEGRLLETRYVSAFDFGEDTSLHLSVRHGADEAAQRRALTAYAGHFAQAGYEACGESPDYLPALLELASALQDEAAASLLRAMRADVQALRSSLAAKGLADYASLLDTVAGVEQAFEEEVSPCRA